METTFLASMMDASLRVWQNNLEKMYELIIFPIDEFNGGAIYEKVIALSEVMKSVALSLMTLFFLLGIMRKFTSFSELKSFETALKLLIRFSLSKLLIDFATDFLLSVLTIAQGIIKKAFVTTINFDSVYIIPKEISVAIEKCSFLETIPVFLIALIASVVIWALSIRLLLIIYARFFKIYMYMAIAPIPLSAMSGDGYERYALNFLRSFSGICFEGIVISICLLIFSFFINEAPGANVNDGAFMMVLSFMGQVIFNILILNTLVSSSDRLVHEMIW